MRYSFNMVTMTKEKVNTHFSFPMILDMAGYVEKRLMPQHYLEEKEMNENEGTECQEENYQYELIGVTVHTGTADGGHYYSFIRNRERTNKSQTPSTDQWYLFNDAEVKLFDASQIAAECFGGEMTVIYTFICCVHFNLFYLSYKLLYFRVRLMIQLPTSTWT